MTPLYRMLHRWASEPFIWGQNDCCLCLADFYREVWGEDPAAHLRGTYHDIQSCMRTGWFTDPVSVVADCLSTVMEPRMVDELRPGVVAVVGIPDGKRMMPMGAVWLGTCWGAKGVDGVTTLHTTAARQLAAWDISYEA